MADQENTTTQLELLQIYRLNLSHYLRQKAIFGIAYTPPSVIHGIREARENISRIKASLRSSGTMVEGHPDDEEAINMSPYDIVHSNQNFFLNDTFPTHKLDQSKLEWAIKVSAGRHSLDGRPVSLIYLDLDKFTGINGRFGQKTGNEIIRIVTFIHRIALKESRGFIARWISDEFIICLYNTVAESTLQQAENIRSLIQVYNWTSVAPELYVTGSFGVAQYGEQEPYKEWILRAIQGTTEAKRSGGNNVKLGPIAVPKNISRELSDHSS